MLAGARSRHTEQKGKDHAMASYLSVVMSGELNSLGRLCPCLWAQRVDILPSLSVRMFTWDFSEAAQAIYCLRQGGRQRCPGRLVGARCVSALGQDCENSGLPWSPTGARCTGLARTLIVLPAAASNTSAVICGYPQSNQVLMLLHQSCPHTWRRRASGPCSRHTSESHSSGTPRTWDSCRPHIIWVE